MRILFLSPRQCWPTASGAKLREYYFLKALGERTELTYVYFSEPGEAALTARELPFCSEIVKVDPPRTYTPGRILRGLTGRWPLTIENYTSDEMKQALEGVLRRSKFDLFHMDRISVAAYDPFIRSIVPNARLVYNWHNIDSETLWRYAALTKSLPRRWYAKHTARRLESVERQLLGSAQGILVCSERERQTLLPINPNARIAAIDNGVDVPAFASLGAPNGSKPKRLLFVGQMSYHANADGVVWFSKEVWPEMHARYPGLTLTIVGANPGPAVLALRSTPGVEVTGTVPDVRPYYSEAYAAIVPLRVGGGTRLKILEALAAGIPVISTALGAEGLATKPGETFLLAETPQEWLAALASLDDPGFKHALIERGRELVQSRYDWASIGRTLYETYCGWLDVKPA